LSFALEFFIKFESVHGQKNNFCSSMKTTTAEYQKEIISRSKGSQNQMKQLMSLHPADSKVCLGLFACGACLADDWTTTKTNQWH
jgi:hypothetical protein